MHPRRVVRSPGAFQKSHLRVRGWFAPTPQSSGVFPGVQRELRPVLAVGNAATVGPVGSVVYQFDLSTNPDFRPLALSGTIDQQLPRTLFAVSSDLLPGTTYFWHVRTIALASGFASPYSAIQRFATIDPPPPGAAALQLYVANGCRTFFGEREFTVYGDLIVSGSHWRFTVLPNTNADSTIVFDLAMELEQTSGRLAGTVHGMAIDPIGFPINIWRRSGSSPASVAGTVGMDGTAAGTFNGTFNFAHPSFGLGDVCIGADIPWVLKPSR